MKWPWLIPGSGEHGLAEPYDPPSVVVDGYDAVNQYHANRMADEDEIEYAIAHGTQHPPWCKCQRRCGGDQ